MCINPRYSGLIRGMQYAGLIYVRTGYYLTSSAITVTEEFFVPDNDNSNGNIRRSLILYFILQ